MITIRSNMMFFSKILASFFGVGYIKKGGGTVAALTCCFLWWLLGGGLAPAGLQVVWLAVVFAVGVVTANMVETKWGHDSNRMVIDEVQGMLTALFLLPGDPWYAVAALALFRFFDIFKPLGIRRMEKLPGGWGVMLDDLLAGIYSNVILQVVINRHFFT